MSSETTLNGMDMLWIKPICSENCSVNVNVMDLTFDQLMKINEYLNIQNAYMALVQKEQERKSNSKGR